MTGGSARDTRCVRLRGRGALRVALVAPVVSGLRLRDLGCSSVRLSVRGRLRGRLRVGGSLNGERTCDNYK